MSNEFADTCSRYGLNVLVECSGLALVEGHGFKVIAVVTRNGDMDQTVSRLASDIYRRRMRDINWSPTDISRLVKPNQCMSWEQYKDKYL